MREIKFRSAFFNIADDKFSFFAYWGFIDYYGMYDQKTFTSPATSGRHYRKFENQYTGLKDKNGVEIYEGDIVNCVPKDDYNTESNEHMYGVRVVRWEDTHASFYYSNFVPMNWWGIQSYEVIGNIYENKNLLK